MKTSHLFPLAAAGLLFAAPAPAQTPGPNVNILRLSGPQLGVRLAEVDRDAVSRLKLKEEKGALVTEVLKNSAAEKAGIREDDVIVGFQGVSILTASQLSRLVRDTPSGRHADIDLVRAGAPIKVTATLEDREWSLGKGERPDMAELSQRLNEKMKDLGDLRWKSEGNGWAGPGHAFTFEMDKDSPAWSWVTRTSRGRLGITYDEIGDQLVRYFKGTGDSAVLVESVVEGSPAEKAGLKAGDLVTKVGGTTIRNGADLMKAVRGLEGGKPAPVSVWRDGRNVDLTVTLADEDRKVAARPHPVS